MDTAWRDRGSVDGATVQVATDEHNLPPRFVALPMLALDEYAETFWSGRVRAGAAARADQAGRAVAVLSLAAAGTKGWRNVA